MFAGLGILSQCQPAADVAYAISPDISTWDGTTYDDSQITDTDFKQVNSNYYYIYTAAGLSHLAWKINNDGWVSSSAKVYLEADINLANQEWTPIGINTNYFSGEFFGQNHTIYNMKIWTAYTNVGLFGNSTGVIKDLNLQNVDIKLESATQTVGALVGLAGVRTDNTIVSGCYATGTIVVNASSSVGGIVGAVKANTDLYGRYEVPNAIEKLKSSVSITSGLSTSATGGIVGQFLGNRISKAANYGTIAVSGGDVGGIVGALNDNTVTLSDVYNVGGITSSADANVGGLIGKSATGRTANGLTRAYNVGQLVGIDNSLVGGLIGYVGKEDKYTITNAFNVKDNGASSAVSFAGENAKTKLFYHNTTKDKSGHTLSNVYFNGTSATNNDISGIAGITNLDAIAQTKSFYTMQGWDFEDWQLTLGVNNTYPYLKDLEGFGVYNNDLTHVNFEGSGTETSPYLIKTAGDLAYLSAMYATYHQSTRVYYVLQNDIDLTGRTWRPIGTSASPFRDVFDGNNHTIKGITASMQEGFDAYGLFGYTQGAIIKNVIVTDINYLTTGTGIYTGAIVGRPSSTYLINSEYRELTTAVSKFDAVGNSIGIFFYKGRNNFKTVSGYTNKTSTLTVTGYDVEVDMNGGTIYKTGSITKANIVTGEYHVLVQAGTKAQNSTLAGVEGYKNKLPGLYNNEDDPNPCVIKEGYKFVGFLDNTAASFSNNANNLTITAEYEAKTVKVTFYKNSYENLYLQATERKEERNLPYNAVLQTMWPEMFNITRDKFQLVGIYLASNFTNQTDGNFRLTQDDGYNIYAKWAGKSLNASEAFDVTVTLGKYANTSDSDYAAKSMFNYSDAVQSLILKNSAGNAISSSVSADGSTYTFTINTTTYSDAIEDYYSFELTLNEGYKIASGSNIQFNGMNYDQNYNNYGKLLLHYSESSDIQTQINFLAGSQKMLSVFNSVRMHNLYEDYSINLTLEREEYSKTLKLEGQTIYFAVAPKTLGDNSGIKIGITSQQSLSTDHGVVSIVGKYVGYDFQNQAFFANNENFGIDNWNQESTFMFTIGGVRYKYATLENNSYALYRMQQLDGGDVSDTIVKWSLDAASTASVKKYNINYFYNSEFVFIFSTENMGVAFEDTYETLTGLDVDDNEVTLDEFAGTNLVRDSNGSKYTKYQMEFSNMKSFDSFYIREGVKFTGLELITERTSIALEYSVFNEQGAADERLSKFLSDEMSYIAVGGSASFKINPDEFFRLNLEEGNDYYTPDNINPSGVIKVLDENNGLIRLPYTYTIDGSGIGTVTIDFNISGIEVGSYKVQIFASRTTFSIIAATAEIVGGGIQQGDFNNEIDVKIYTAGVDLTSATRTLSGFTFDQDITFWSKTKDLDENKPNNSYVFVGWHDGTAFLTNSNNGASGTPVPFTTTYQQLVAYGDLAIKESGVGKIFAVYQKKSYDVDLYEDYVFDSETSEKVTTSSLNIETSATKTIESGVTTSFNFETIGGQDGSGYYITNFKLYLEGVSTEIQGVADDDVQTYFLSCEDAVEYALEQWHSQTDTILYKRYLVLPVIAKKTATLNFTAGAEGVNITTPFTKENKKFQEFVDVSDIVSTYVSKKGYTRGILTSAEAGELVGSSIYLDRTFFDNFDAIDTHVEANYAYIWTPNAYTITFNPNGGTYTRPGTASMLVQYDAELELDEIPTEFEREGYEFESWTYGEDSIIENRQVTDVNGLLFGSRDSARIYTYDGNVELYAKWRPISYTIAVHTNGANRYYRDGWKDNIANEFENYEVYSLAYGSTFASILADYTGDYAPVRDSFVFDGFYTSATDKIVSNQVTASTLFTTSISQVDLSSSGVVLNLYIGWSFANPVVSLPISLVDVKNLTYTGQNIIVSAGEFLTDELAEWLTFTYENGEFAIQAPENAHVNIVATIDEEIGTSFIVKNVQAYNVNFSVKVQDGASFLNLGDVASLSYSLRANVGRANIEFLDSVTEDQVWLINVKKLVRPFMPSTKSNAINACATFSDFALLYKTYDDSLEDVSNLAEIYKYVMIKYYLLNIETDLEKYSNWTYEEFLAYETENVALVNSKIQDLKYFDYYIYQENATTREIDGYGNVLRFQSPTVNQAVFNSEIVVNSIRLVNTISDEITPNQTYEFRAYVMEIDAVDNYNVYVDSSGAYITIGEIYVLPQIFMVEDVEPNQTYFDGDVTTTNLDWTDERDTYEYNGATYYRVENGLYLKAVLTTSNVGRSDIDTTYNFLNETNRLYFKEQSAIMVQGSVIYDVSNRFNFILPASFNYTILNTNSIAEVVFNAKYLSGEGSVSLMDIDFVSELLNISAIVYNVGGADKRAEINKVGMFKDNGIIVFEVKQTKSNNVSVLITNAVKKIIVTTKDGGSSISSNTLYKYIKLYKWSSTPTDVLDGTMEENGLFELNYTDIDFTSTSKIEYYAIYTDLVLVNYNLNFPENYQAKSISSTVLKLGYSSLDNWFEPYEDGFELVDMVVDQFNVSYTELFDANGLFIGLSNYATAHAQILINVSWSVEAIDSTQIFEGGDYKVGSFSTLSYSDIMYIANENTKLFNYTYSWKYNGTEISEAYALTLPSGGVASASGEYSLTVTATIKSEFASIVESGNESSSATATFVLTLHANKIVGITFTTDNVKTYDATDFMNSWYTEIEYKEFDGMVYEETTRFALNYYTAEGVVSHTVTKDSVAVSEMINAGVYQISVNVDPDYYQIETGVTVTTTFNYTINPREINLNTQNIAFAKRFNETDPVLEKDINTGVEGLKLTFVRESGEDVGSYELYLHDITEELRQNYKILMNNTVVFANSTLVADDVSVGTFTIQTAGTLKLSYQTTAALGENLIVQFDEAGYTAELTDQLKLLIYCGENVYKTIDIILYDVDQEQEISNADVLDLLKDNIADIDVQFYSTTVMERAFNQAAYSYYLVNGQDISKYYSNIIFENGYQFVITKKIIDVTSLDADKEYDGKSTANFDLQGNVITDITLYDGVYIQGIYADIHAANGVRVDLMLVATGTQDTTNYELSSNSTLADISKLTATLTATLTKASYVYGEVSEHNFEGLIDGFTVTAGLEDVTDLLVSGYYTLTYNLPNGITTNSSGCLYVGQYQLMADSTFADFTMTLSLPQIVVTARTVSHAIVSGMFRKLVSTVTVGPYTEELLVKETGDTLTLQYYVDGMNPGDTFVIGQYHLYLQTNTFANNSIVVTIPASNYGLHVLADTDVVYMRIDNQSILTQTYNGDDFEFGFNALYTSIEIQNGSTTISSTISFWKEGASISITDISSASIYYGNNQTSFIDSGSYVLNLNLNSNTYPNVLLETNYVFTISKQTINVASLTFTKEYDTTTLLTLNYANDVNIIGRFADANVATNKSITLNLSGANSSNYTLSTTSATGDITKANAEVSLIKSSFVYGQISQGDKLNFAVTANDNAVAVDEFDVALTIYGAQYSTIWHNLLVGNYQIQMTYTSNNYNLTLAAGTTLSVSKYQLDVAFNESGKVVDEFGTARTETNAFTISYTTPLYEDIVLNVVRASGSAIGYYKAISATTTDNNYDIASLLDNTEGVYRIVKSSTTIYLLFTNAEQITVDEDEKVSYVYDGRNYKNISLAVDENGDYSVVFTDGVETKEFRLYAYTYADNVYTKTTKKVLNLTASLNFNDSNVKNVGNYSFVASNENASNYDVKLMRYGKLRNLVEITRKEVYFSNSTLTRVFDNKLAQIEYEEASELLTGIVESDNIGLYVEYLDGANVAKYVGTNYTINANLVGQVIDIENYHLNIKTAGNNDISASITKAEMLIEFSSQSLNYGSALTLQATYTADIDLTGYDTSRISINLSLQNPQYSSSGSLVVGEYTILCATELQDFTAKYLINGVLKQNYDSSAAVLVTKKVLAIAAQTGTTLEDIFTKTYNGQTDCDATGVLLVGLNAGDDVSIDSANYESAGIGRTIRVSFVLDGSDAANYEVSPWLYGVINPIVVNIVFDYNAHGDTNVTSNAEDMHIEHITRLAFPFVSTANVSANSYDTNKAYTQNFPNSLSGYAGHNFTTWTLRFADVVENSDKYNFLLNLARTYSVSSDYQDGVFIYNVENKAGTASLLNYLIKDDEDNIAGLYYGDNDNITITFVAAWNISNYDFYIYYENETGAEEILGTINVNGTDLPAKQRLGFDYGDTVEISVTPNAHCTYYGFFDRSGVRYEGQTIEGLSIYQNGSSYVWKAENITRGFDIHVRFREQRVTAVVDITGATDTVVSMEGFVKSGNAFTYTTKYSNLSDISIEDLGISRLGYAVESVDCNSQEILAEDFDDTLLQTFVSGATDATITIAPTFEAVGVVVTLDYNYDDVTENISVDFNQAYGTSAGWVEEPERSGYIFAGWFDGDGNQILGDTLMQKAEAHTLTARWDIASFNFRFTATNATISVGGVNVESIDENITFEDTFTFVVTANAGYSLPQQSEWADIFNVDVTNNVANVILTMPGRDVNENLAAIANINELTISGDRLDDVRVYNVDNGQVEIVANAGIYNIATGTTIQIVASAIYGYQMTEMIDVVSARELNIQKSVDDGILTATITGFTADVELTLHTEESRFDVALTFDDATKIEYLIVDETRKTDLSDITLSVVKGREYYFYIKYVYGNKFDDYFTIETYVIDSEQEVINGETYTKITLSNVEKSGTVELLTTLESYTLTLEFMSYDENKQVVDNPNNRAIIRPRGVNPLTATYGTVVQLVSIGADENYNFAGWSKDGVMVFDSSTSLNYTIERTETIYAIYSSTKFNISFKTLNFYTLYTEYGDESRIERIYQEIENVGEGFFEDENTERHATAFSLFYGANKTVYFKTPAGYKFFSYGYMLDNTFIFLGGDDTSDIVVPINISTMEFDTDNLDVTICAVVRALSSKISVKTQIDINGMLEENVDVGSAKLVAANADDVNEYGYVDGTRTHYQITDFEDGHLINDKEFNVIAYTQEEVYIQVSVDREGYRIYDVTSSAGTLELVDVEQNIYRLTNFVGGENVDIDIFFRPNLNKIDIKFMVGEEKAAAGAFTFETEDARKVFASGVGYPAIEISAYTDTSFTVVAYIGIGYYVDINNIEIVDENDLVDVSSITYSPLVIANTGFSGKVTFNVSGYLGTNEIFVKVLPRKYTVKLYDEKTLLATIKNVEYGAFINLSQNNVENITISDERLVFENGKLNVKISEQNFNFEGYFSYENGAGIRYINSDGLACYPWEETGYYYNTGSSRYELADNVSFNTETGETEITLYLYMSYNKTRIKFNITPSYVIDITAQDMISGVDYTNSWYYDASPNYIEVAFNTPLKIVAPEIDGYKFYQFIISQRDLNGNWLTDVVSYSNSIPWETNELDSIVECNIQVIYFAQVTVVAYNGKGTYALEQEAETSQAQLLINDGYIDTTRVFTLTALPAEGYEFVRWNNVTSSRFSADAEWDGILINQKSTFVMNLQGKEVSILFTERISGVEENYNSTYGQILSVTATNGTGRSQTTSLGSYSNGTFVHLKNSVDVRVGDEVTLTLAIDHGYGVTWNREDITFGIYSGDRYTFKILIAPEMLDETDGVRLLPTFRNEVLSIYVTREFAESETGKGALDQDNVDFAGYVTYQDRRVNVIAAQRNTQVVAGIVTNLRYYVYAIKLTNYDHEFDVLQNYENGRLTLSSEFLNANDISGIVSLKVTFARLLWKDKTIESTFVGSGTEKDPYLISTIEDLVLMMQKVNAGAQNENGIYYYNAHYYLRKDIALSERFWTPIGTNEFAFNGTFNFGGHLITSIYLPYNYEQTSYNGLFGVLGDDAKIIMNYTATWYWYLVGIGGAGLIATTISLVTSARKRKKRRQQMSVK